ncbi:MAG: hypothetical protein IPL19_07300 [Sandaracinaceae bacterium]|nr:hypothetical protein [Sandaracinaceae bacterium]MBK7776142.1 hypothetical protein [Sandaracinaceae bacterium]MBK8407780.1 hypothetical protein [Sandaracinaceae bacterium]MBK8589603.1 hypothetical protein [Sandaracinaceae bacterium]MBP7681743.1 hypothetical protein [Deltaproteobacteria bacterium]
MSGPEEFVHRTREGFYAGLTLFLVFPAMGVGALLESVADIPQGPIPLIVILAFAVVVYFGLGVENRVVVDERSIRFSHASVRFGMRGAETVAWEIPLGPHTTVREVTTRTPSSRGGWNTGTTLHFSETQRIHDTELGLKGAPSSPYDALVISLKRRLGDGFTSEQAT